MLGNGHVRFGGRAEETDQPKGHRAGSYPHLVKVAGRWRYLYRAVDQYGQVIDVLLSEQRDTAAARRFFTRALAHGPRAGGGHHRQSRRQPGSDAMKGLGGCPGLLHASSPAAARRLG